MEFKIIQFAVGGGMLTLQAVLGIILMVILGWVCSEKRCNIKWRRVGIGLTLQVVLAALFLHVSWLDVPFSLLNSLALVINAAAQNGASFVFGYLSNVDVPFQVIEGKSSWIMAFSALPVVIVVSALSALLFHWRVLPCIIGGLSNLLQKTMGIGGALGLGVVANVFMGMVESPLLIRPYLRHMSRSELFALMVTGMATLAGTVLVLYATFLAPILENPLKHIITASLISCPAALLFAELMVPEEATSTAVLQGMRNPYHGSMEAICAGTEEGLRVFLNIIGTLLVFVALVYLVNQALGFVALPDGQVLTAQHLLGWVLMPFMWLLGIPWFECAQAGGLMGVKVVLNELLAYMHMGMLAEGTFSPRTTLILTYALCGFANFGSLGIMLAGLCTMAPERAQEFRTLGMRSLLAGNLATCMTGAVVGILF